MISFKRTENIVKMAAYYCSFDMSVSPQQKFEFLNQAKSKQNKVRLGNI